MDKTIEEMARELAEAGKCAQFSNYDCCYPGSHDCKLCWSWAPEWEIRQKWEELQCQIN